MSSKSKKIEMVPPTVETGEGVPSDEIKAEFYKNIIHDVLYEKVEGKWVQKPIIPHMVIYT